MSVRACAAISLLGAMLMATVCPAATPAVEVVDCPKVLPDRAIDTSSLESIIQGVVKPGMSEQDKFLALYQFYRRMVFHHRYMAADRREILRVINSYGFNLCGSQAGSFSVLLQKAGFNTRVVQANAKGYGGHTVLEVEYDGGWHAFDTMTAFYVLNRAGKLASFAELKADPALLKDAAKEGRLPPEYGLCTREIEPEQKGIEQHCHADRPWSLLRWGEGLTVPGFWEAAIASASSGKTNDLYGGYVAPGVLDIQLKPNEEYVRLWGNVGLWLKSPSFSKFGPFHTCGHADEYDTPNFKYFEPYKKEHEFCRYTYRYYGNGWLEWKPDAARGEVQAAAKNTVNLEYDAATGMFRPAKPGQPASLETRVKSPYAVVKVEIDFDLEQEDGAQTTLALGTVSGQKGRENVQWNTLLVKSDKAAGLQQAVYENSAVPVYDYALKVETKGAAARFNLRRVKTIFQLNWAALPSLYPGENTIVVSANSPQKLQAHKLLVTYEWAEGEGWKADRTDTQTVTELPHTYKLQVDVPKDKMPRMKRLVLRLEPR